MISPLQKKYDPLGKPWDRNAYDDPSAFLSKYVYEKQMELDRRRQKGKNRGFMTGEEAENLAREGTFIAKAKQRLENMPWTPGMKRTVGVSEGVELLQESGGDLDRYEKIIKSDYEATRNKFGDYDERTKSLKNKLDQISQFKYYAGEEPEWQKIINPPKPKLPTAKRNIGEIMYNPVFPKNY
jgi:hypothetical protein